MVLACHLWMCGRLGCWLRMPQPKEVSVCPGITHSLGCTPGPPACPPTLPQRMGAYRCILTHFSQRYPKWPEGLPLATGNPTAAPPAADDDTNRDNGVTSMPAAAAGGTAAVAFDGMRVPLALLPVLPALMPAVQAALADGEEEGEDQNEAEARQQEQQQEQGANLAAAVQQQQAEMAAATADAGAA